MCRLSIIIPMYNVEKYIGKCLDSCISQKEVRLGSDYEIICVNDGTKDESASIARGYSYKHEGITVIDQNNQGLSMARNNGLKIAKGKYVWFVDSDDWIEDNCLKKVLDLLSDCDILAIDYMWAYDDSSKNQPVCYGKSGKVPGKDFLLDGYRVQAQMYVFRRSFLIKNNLLFYPGVYHEDTEFTPRALYFAEKVCYLNSPVYYFYKRPNSISTVPNPKRAFDYISVSISLNDFIKGVEGKYRICFYNQIARNISEAMNVISQADKNNRKKFCVYLRSNKSVMESMSRASNWRRRTMGLFLYLFPSFAPQVLILIKRKGYSQN